MNVIKTTVDEHFHLTSESRFHYHQKFHLVNETFQKIQDLFYRNVKELHHDIQAEFHKFVDDELKSNTREDVFYEAKSQFGLYIPKETYDVSDWFVVDEFCATKTIIRNTESIDYMYRLAFIEKSPRVRVFGDVWYYGEKDSDYGESVESRNWCDEQLKLLGHRL